MWLAFVRHAESVSNQQGELSGHSRSPLTAEGRRQAARHPLATAYAERAPGGESWAERSSFGCARLCNIS